MHYALKSDLIEMYKRNAAQRDQYLIKTWKHGDAQGNKD